MITLMMFIDILDHFMVRALCAGLLLCCLCGPMGCLVLWKRLGFLGDTLAHASLLGVCIAALAHLSPLACVLGVTVTLALILAKNRPHSTMTTSTLLAMIAQGTIALGVVGLSLTPARSNLTTFLFGDLLALSRWDLLMLLILVPVALGIVRLYWNDLLKVTLSEDMAASQGINVSYIRSVFMVTLALTVAMASQLVGILMVASLLIIPSASARILAKTPESMAKTSVILAMVGTIMGLHMSWTANTPTTPTITLCFLGLFFVLLIVKKVLGRS